MPTAPTQPTARPKSEAVQRSWLAVAAGLVLAAVPAAAQDTNPEQRARSAASSLTIDGPAAWPNSDWLSDAKLLDGLRERSLFPVAEAFCRNKLARGGLSPRLKCETVLELSRTLAAHAVHSPPAQREALWTAAAETIETLLREQPANPRALVLRLQAAMVEQGRGELARRESELLPADATLPPTAQRHLREAIGQLTALAEDVAAALRTAPRGLAATDDILTEEQLIALDRHVRYQIAKAEQEIAATYPAGDNNRIDALAQADQRLEPIAAANSDDPVVWQARVDRVAVERQLGRAAQAEARIEQLSSRARPAWVAARLAIEHALLATDAGRFDEALKWLDSDEIAQGGIAREERDDLRLAVVLTAWRAAHAAGDAKAASARQSEAATLVRQIDEQYAPYWSRRAKLRAAATIAAGAGTNDATLLATAAENFLHTGRAAEAVAAYDRAAAAARAAGDDELAFRLALTAAAVEQQQKHLEAAMQRYADLARAMPKAADAPRAHLQAAWNAAYRFGPRSAEYRKLIDEHLRLWSDSPTADDARLWLARSLQSQRKWREAAAAYRQVRPTATAFDSAVAGAALCYEQLFAAPPNDAQAAAEASRQAAEAADAAQWFESILAAKNEQWPPQLSAAQRTAVLAATKLRLRHVTGSRNDVVAFLRTAKQHAAEAPPDWLAAVNLLEAEALAATGDFAAAEKAIAALLDAAQTGESPPDAPPKPSAAGVADLLAALASQRTAKQNDPQAARGIASIELTAGKLLAALRPAGATSPRDSAATRRAAAEALAAAGRRDDALAAYRKLAAEYPADPAVQRGYAALLAAGEDRASLAAALDQWRLVESKTRPATADWFAAKYEVAALHERLGDKRQALSVVTLLAALYPELGGKEMKAKFDALQRRCQQ